MFKTNLKSLSLLFFLTVDWRKLFDSVSLISQYDINVSKLNLQIYIQRKKKKRNFNILTNSPPPFLLQNIIFMHTNLLIGHFSMTCEGCSLWS